MSTNPIDKVHAALVHHGLQRSGDAGNQWTALCPAHDDKRQSLSIGVDRSGKVLLKCFANCAASEIVRAMGLEMKDLFPDERPPAVTLAELASAKKLPVKWLRDNCGLKDLPDNRGVGIPYQDEHRTNLFTRRRTALRAKDGTWQPKGHKLQAYGQWRLPLAREKGEIVCVEGETDCWTLWYRNFHAIGLPGAAAARSLEQSHIAGLKRFLIWREPGEAGSGFVGSVARRLRRLGFTGEICVASSPDHKDPSALWLANPDGFDAAMAALLSSACPVTDEDEKATARPRKETILPGEAKTPQPENAIAPGPNQLPPEYFALTDLGNAKRLVHHFGRDIRWCEAWKCWLVWDGNKWEPKANHIVMSMAARVPGLIMAEGETATDRGQRDRLREHSLQSEGWRAQQAMYSLARYRPEVTVKPDQFDVDPWIINCPNGTLDLRTGKLRSHERLDYLTKMCVTTFEPQATCPLWEQFVSDVFPGEHAPVIPYIQRLLGYFLTGDVSTHMMAVFWGCGGNGKGTLLNTFLKVIGRDYAATAPSELLMAKRGDRHPTELATLCGKRLVVCQETEEGSRLHESLVKSLTGGDEISARRMHEDFWSFFPTHKLVLGTNHKPEVRGNDSGIWRRLRLVPFTAVFSGAREDTRLPERLITEASGILAWCVRGCLQWQQTGEQIPVVVRAATDEYKSDGDIVRQFVDECCVTGPSESISAAALYAEFVKWMESNGEMRRFPQRKFGVRMTSLGFQRYRSHAQMYDGIGLIKSTQSKHSATNGVGRHHEVMPDWLND